MWNKSDVVVIGAGPYGLSLAAHLRARGVPHRIFGRPMESWRSGMPRGMYLKSPGHGSNLSDPDGTHTLERFCATVGEPYGRWETPVPIDRFTRYGQWFQEELVPDLDRRNVLQCSAAEGGFRIDVEDGETITAKSVVVSNGFRHSARVPDELAGLPEELVSHSSDHHGFDGLAGKDVIVIGAGQSALESAALLREAGGSPTLLVRRDCLSWNPPLHDKQSLYQRLRHPDTGLGPGWKYIFYAHKLRPFYYLPQQVRDDLVWSVLGPSGAYWLRERVEGRIPAMLGCSLRGARQESGQVVLEVERDGGRSEVRADHVIAATGYRVSPQSFPFLSPELCGQMAWDEGSPLLSRDFESTVPGLHFVGLASARRFGPVMRFVDGVHPTVPTLAQVLAERVGRAG